MRPPSIRTRPKPRRARRTGAARHRDIREYIQKQDCLDEGGDSRSALYRSLSDQEDRLPTSTSPRTPCHPLFVSPPRF